VNLMRQHDVFFTLAEHLGEPDCLIPTCGVTWHPTRQPIVLADWPVTSAPDGVFTTVMSWKIEPTPPTLGGRVYGGKDVEFERFMELPRHTPEALEVALSGAAPRARLGAAGWRVRDAYPVSATLDAYRDYLRSSRGECSVAKNVYVATRSGWFSTRSAAYLACGKPVVVQDTGFPAHVPTGPGVHAFRDTEEAVAALAAIPGGQPRAPRPPPRARDRRGLLRRRSGLPPPSERRRLLKGRRWHASFSPATSSANRSAATPGRRRTTSSASRRSATMCGSTRTRATSSRPTTRA